MKNTPNLRVIDGDLASDDPVIGLQTAGKGPTQDNWLKSMKEGTIFLTRIKQDKGFMLNQFFVVNNKPDTGTWLRSAGGEDLWVDAQRFSGQWEQVEVLRIPTDEPERNRSDQQLGLEHNATAEEFHEDDA